MARRQNKSSSRADAGQGELGLALPRRTPKKKRAAPDERPSLAQGRPWTWSEIKRLWRYWSAVSRDRLDGDECFVEPARWDRYRREAEAAATARAWRQDAEARLKWAVADAERFEGRQTFACWLDPKKMDGLRRHRMMEWLRSRPETIYSIAEPAWNWRQTVKPGELILMHEGRHKTLKTWAELPPDTQQAIVTRRFWLRTADGERFAEGPEDVFRPDRAIVLAAQHGLTMHELH